MLRRITLLATATAFVAVTLLAVPLGFYAARTYLDDERLEVHRVATTTATSARTDQLSRVALSADDEFVIGIYARSGTLVSGRGPHDGGSVVRAALDGRESSAIQGDRIAAAAPVSDGDQVTHAVLVTAGLGPAHQRALHAWLAIAGIGLAAVSLSGLGAWAVSRRLAAPVRELTATARRIGAGDLNARAAPSGVDELDTLVVALNDSAEQLQAMVAHEREFSAEVSHQLRTPLSGLRLELESMQDSSVPADVERALAAVDRLEETIADVIALARGLPSARSSPLTDLLDGIEVRWRGRLAEQSRALRVVRDGSGSEVVAISPQAAAQIFDVLVENAFRHGAGAITIRVRRTQSSAAIDVSDEGVALTAEPHELFGRGRSRHGDGIGLPFARKLAETEGCRVVLSCADPPTFSLVTPVGL